MYVFILPLHRKQCVSQGQFLCGVLFVLFPYFYTSRRIEDKDSSLRYNLPKAGGKIVGFILFSMVIVLQEIQTA